MCWCTSHSRRPPCCRSAGPRRSPCRACGPAAQTTSKTFSKLWPLLVQPLTIWMRSRLPDVGSFTAHTMNVGALPWPAADRRPWARPSHSRSSPSLVAEHVRGVLQRPNRRTLDVRAADGEGLLALHGLEQGSARVLLGPYAGQAGRAQDARVHASVHLPDMRSSIVRRRAMAPKKLSWR